MPQAGEPESEESERRATSQLASAEFRRTAASSSAVGRTAQARHVLILGELDGAESLVQDGRYLFEPPATARLVQLADIPFADR